MPYYRVINGTYLEILCSFRNPRYIGHICCCCFKGKLSNPQICNKLCNYRIIEMLNVNTGWLKMIIKQKGKGIFDVLRNIGNMCVNDCIQLLSPTKILQKYLSEEFSKALIMFLETKTILFIAISYL